MELTKISAPTAYFMIGKRRALLLEEIKTSFEFGNPVSELINSRILECQTLAEVDRCFIERLAPKMISIHVEKSPQAPLTELRNARKRIKAKIFRSNGVMRRTRMNELIALLRIAKLDDWRPVMVNALTRSCKAAPMALVDAEERMAWLQLQCESAALCELKDLPAPKLPSGLDPTLKPYYEGLAQRLVVTNEDLRSQLKRLLA